MKKLINRAFGGRLQPVLIACFGLVAALTVGLNTLVVFRVINDYLSAAQDDRIARDMGLAAAFYQLKLDEMAAISHRLVLDAWVIDNLSAASQGQSKAVAIIDQEITNKITVLALGGTHLIAVLNADGDIVVGRVLSPEGRLSPMILSGNWAALPIVQASLTSGRAQAATEIVPSELLAQVDLDRQAAVDLLETPKAAAEPFDARAGTGGLTLIGVAPLYNEAGHLIGAVLSAYLFNNDFTLVDRIKEIAGIDTVTIFFGDLRVSTNVMTLEGERAVGTRLSQDVFDVVLLQGNDYVGRAFVVNDWFLSRYQPLRDHRGQVVGILYVGARESTFQALVQNFNRQVGLIALVCLALAAVIAVPIARLITQPISDLVEANRRLRQGDMSVQVQPYGSGELALLGHAFNKMAATLERTQQQLLYKERLASMGQLAAGVAHEINNPLGTILLFGDALLRETPADQPQRKDLQMIVDETMRCKKIVGDLLNFARQQDVLLQETDVHAVLEQVIETLVRQPSFGKVAIERHYAANLPPIQADYGQLQQVFVNLLNNAAEAMEGQGTLTLTTCAFDRHAIEIVVSDTGSGISQENLNKLFTPFFTTKPPGKGTGLGLSIVYGIIKMHRGQVRVSSHAGRGTSVTVTLPVRQPAQPVIISGAR
jgi:two-component system, NtrC family, sensor kinase